jgi:hypothetical protein
MTLLAGGIILTASAYRAYIFPVMPASSTDTLVTTLIQGWQSLVITISLAILGILAIITGIILYGIGRITEEIQSSQAEKNRDKSEPRRNDSLVESTTQSVITIKRSCGAKTPGSTNSRPRAPSSR